MNCEAARELLSARLDGALFDIEAEALSDHLEACADCRARAAEFEAVVDLVREIPTPSTPDSLAVDVVARIPRRRRLAPIKWLAPLAAAACLLIVARIALVGSGSEEVLEVAGAPKDEIRFGAGPVTADGEAPEEELGLGRGASRSPVDAPPGAPSSEGVPAPDADPRARKLPAYGEKTVPPASDAGAWRARPAPGNGIRTWFVRGAQPDAAAGVILAELRSRRTRESAAVPPGERVVQDRSGEVAGMVLSLTADEIEFVTCLLTERPGVRIDRSDEDDATWGEDEGRKAGTTPADRHEKERADAEDAPAPRVRVRLDFAKR